MTFHKTRKIISGGVLFLFLTTEIARAYPPVEGGAIPEFSLPAELGSVQETHFVPSGENVPFIFHLQTAHAHYESALKIKEIIHYLKRRYKTDLVFAEGASGPLHPEFLQFFKDPALNHKVINALAEKGELTGVDLALENGLTGYGIEHSDFYYLAYKNFKKVLENSNQTESYLRQKRLELDKRASKVFSSELRQLVETWNQFHSGKHNLLGIIGSLREKAQKHLRIDFDDLFSQFEWPQLVRVALLGELEKRTDPEKLEEEKSKLVNWLSEKKLPAEFLEWITGKSVKPEGRSLRTSYETFLATAHPAGFRFKDYPQITYQAASEIFKTELDAYELFSEFERLFDKLFEAVAQTASEKKLIAEYKDLLLLQKLLRLELTREEWNQIKALSDKRKAITTSIAYRLPLNAALRFYRLAERRETVFLAVLKREMKKRDAQKAILVTGGFHAEGLTQLFKKEGMGFATITPHVSGEIDSSLYHEVMLRRSHLEKIDLLLKSRMLQRFSGSKRYVASELSSVEATLLEVGKGIPSRSPYLTERRNFLQLRRSRPEIRKSVGRPSAYPGDKVFKSLLRKYKANQPLIAQKLKVSQMTISNWIRDHGFTRLAKQLRTDYPGDKVFKSLLIKHQAKLAPIAQKLKVGQTTIFRWIRDHRFARLAKRLTKERPTTQGRPSTYPGNRVFKSLLRKYNANQSLIAQKLKVHQTTISLWIRDHRFTELAERLRRSRPEIRSKMRDFARELTIAGALTGLYTLLNVFVYIPYSKEWAGESPLFQLVAMLPLGGISSALAAILAQRFEIHVFRQRSHYEMGRIIRAALLTAIFFTPIYAFFVYGWAFKLFPDEGVLSSKFIQALFNQLVLSPFFFDPANFLIGQIGVVRRSYQESVKGLQSSGMDFWAYAFLVWAPAIYLALHFSNPIYISLIMGTTAIIWNVLAHILIRLESIPKLPVPWPFSYLHYFYSRSWIGIHSLSVGYWLYTGFWSLFIYLLYPTPEAPAVFAGAAGAVWVGGLIYKGKSLLVYREEPSSEKDQSQPRPEVRTTFKADRYRWLDEVPSEHLKELAHYMEEVFQLQPKLHDMENQYPLFDFNRYRIDQVKELGGWEHVRPDVFGRSIALTYAKSVSDLKIFENLIESGALKRGSIKRIFDMGPGYWNYAHGFPYIFPAMQYAVGMENDRAKLEGYADTVQLHQLDANRFKALQGDFREMDKHQELQDLVSKYGKFNLALLQNPEAPHFQERDYLRAFSQLSKILGRNGKLVIVVDEERLNDDGNFQLKRVLSEVNYQEFVDYRIPNDPNRPRIFQVPVRVWVVNQRELAKPGQVRSEVRAKKDNLLEASIRRWHFYHWAGTAITQELPEHFKKIGVADNAREAAKAILNHTLPNAFDATALRVLNKEAGYEGRVSFEATVPSPKELRIVIEDNGNGIAKAILENLFTKSITSKRDFSRIFREKVLFGDKGKGLYLEVGKYLDEEFDRKELEDWSVKIETKDWEGRAYRRIYQIAALGSPVKKIRKKEQGTRFQFNLNFTKEILPKRRTTQPEVFIFRREWPLSSVRVNEPPRAEVRSNDVPLFTDKEIALIKERGELLKLIYPRLSDEAKKILLDPTLLPVMMGIKFAYFRYAAKNEPDPTLLFDELKEIPEAWNTLGLGFNPMFVSSFDAVVIEIIKRQKFLKEKGVLLPEDEEILDNLNKSHSSSNPGLFDREGLRLLNILFQRFPIDSLKGIVIEGVMLGYPDNAIQAMLDETSSEHETGTPATRNARLMTKFKGLGLVVPRNQTEAEEKENTRYLRKTTETLYYAYSLIRNQPDFAALSRELGLPPEVLIEEPHPSLASRPEARNNKEEQGEKFGRDLERFIQEALQEPGKKGRAKGFVLTFLREEVGLPRGGLGKVKPPTIEAIENGHNRLTLEVLNLISPTIQKAYDKNPKLWGAWKPNVREILIQIFQIIEVLSGEDTGREINLFASKGKLGELIRFFSNRKQILQSKLGTQTAVSDLIMRPEKMTKKRLEPLLEQVTNRLIKIYTQDPDPEITPEKLKQALEKAKNNFWAKQGWEQTRAEVRADKTIKKDQQLAVTLRGIEEHDIRSLYEETVRRLKLTLQEQDIILSFIENQPPFAFRSPQALFSLIELLFSPRTDARLIRALEALESANGLDDSLHSSNIEDQNGLLLGLYFAHQAEERNYAVETLALKTKSEAEGVSGSNPDGIVTRHSAGRSRTFLMELKSITAEDPDLGSILKSWEYQMAKYVRAILTAHTADLYPPHIYSKPPTGVFLGVGDRLIRGRLEKTVRKRIQSWFKEIVVGERANLKSKDIPVAQNFTRSDPVIVVQFFDQPKLISNHPEELNPYQMDLPRWHEVQSELIQLRKEFPVNLFAPDRAAIHAYFKETEPEFYASALNDQVNTEFTLYHRYLKLGNTVDDRRQIIGKVVKRFFRPEVRGKVIESGDDSDIARREKGLPRQVAGRARKKILLPWLHDSFSSLVHAIQDKDTITAKIIVRTSFVFNEVFQMFSLTTNAARIKLVALMSPVANRFRRLGGNRVFMSNLQAPPFNTGLILSQILFLESGNPPQPDEGGRRRAPPHSPWLARAELRAVGKREGWAGNLKVLKNVISVHIRDPKNRKVEIHVYDDKGRSFPFQRPELYNGNLTPLEENMVKFIKENLNAPYEWSNYWNFEIRSVYKGWWRDLPAFRRQYAREIWMQDRSYAGVIRHKGKEAEFKDLVRQRYKANYGNTNQTLQDFGFNYKESFTRLLTDLQINLKEIEVLPGDLREGAGFQSKKQLLDYLDSIDWNLKRFQEERFGRVVYSYYKLIEGLGIIEDFKDKVHALFRLYGGRLSSIDGILGLDFNTRIALFKKLRIQFSDIKSFREGYLVPAIGGLNEQQILDIFKEENWKLPRVLARFQKINPNLPQYFYQGGFIDFIRALGMTKAFHDQLVELARKKKWDMREMADELGVQIQTMVKIYREFVPEDPPITKQKQAIQFLDEHDWNFMVFAWKVLTQGPAGRFRFGKFDKSYILVIKKYKLEKKLKTKIEEFHKSTFGNLEGAARQLGFGNAQSGAFRRLLSHLKIRSKDLERNLVPGDLAIDMSHRQLQNKLIQKAPRGFGWNVISFKNFILEHSKIERRVSNAKALESVGLLDVILAKYEEIKRGPSRRKWETAKFFGFSSSTNFEQFLSSAQRLIAKRSGRRAEVRVESEDTPPYYLSDQQVEEINGFNESTALLKEATIPGRKRSINAMNDTKMSEFFLIQGKHGLYIAKRAKVNGVEPDDAEKNMQTLQNERRHMEKVRAATLDPQKYFYGHKPPRYQNVRHGVWNEKLQALVMPYLEGENAYDFFIHQKKAFPHLEHYVRAAVQMMGAVIFLNRLGIVDRDVKLPNFFVIKRGRGSDVYFEFVLIDLGLAYDLQPQDGKLAPPPGLSGTAGYAPAEQWTSGRTPRFTDDVHAMGVTIFRMVKSRGLREPALDEPVKEVNVGDGDYEASDIRWSEIIGKDPRGVKHLRQRIQAVHVPFKDIIDKAIDPMPPKRYPNVERMDLVLRDRIRKDWPALAGQLDKKLTPGEMVPREVRPAFPKALRQKLVPATEQRTVQLTDQIPDETNRKVMEKMISVIDPDLKLVGLLGANSFGHVYLVKRKSSNEVFALKVPVGDDYWKKVHLGNNEWQAPDPDRQWNLLRGSAAIIARRDLPLGFRARQAGIEGVADIENYYKILLRMPDGRSVESYAVLMEFIVGESIKDYVGRKGKAGQFEFARQLTRMLLKHRSQHFTLDGLQPNDDMIHDYLGHFIIDAEKNLLRLVSLSKIRELETGIERSTELQKPIDRQDKEDLKMRIQAYLAMVGIEVDGEAVKKGVEKAFKDFFSQSSTIDQDAAPEKENAKAKPTQRRNPPDTTAPPRPEVRTSFSAKTQLPVKLRNVISAIIRERKEVYTAHSKWDPAVAVFGSARVPKKHPYYQMGVDLGGAIWNYGRHELAVRDGAGPGLMEAVLLGNQIAKGKRRGRPTQGVRIMLSHEPMTSPYAEVVHQYRHFVTRKLALHENIYGAIALPGGFGTLDEVFESWRRGRPLVLLEPQGSNFWLPLMEAFYRSWEEAGLMDRLRIRQPILFSNSIKETLNYIQKESISRPPYKPDRTRLKQLNQELADGFRTLHPLQRNVVFSGKPKEGSRELKIAVNLANYLALRSPWAVRSASWDPILNHLYDVAEKRSWLGKLQAVLFLSPSREFSGRERKMLRQVQGSLALSDESDHQVLMGYGSDAFVFLPGGVGTMNRLFDTLQLEQIRKSNGEEPKPILLIGRQFWQPIKDALIHTMLNRLDSLELISKGDEDLLHVVDNVKEAVEILEFHLANRPEVRSKSKIETPRASARANEPSPEEGLQHFADFLHGLPETLASQLFLIASEEEPRLTKKIEKLIKTIRGFRQYERLDKKEKKALEDEIGAGEDKVFALIFAVVGKVPVEGEVSAERDVFDIPLPRALIQFMPLSRLLEPDKKRWFDKLFDKVVYQRTAVISENELEGFSSFYEKFFRVSKTFSQGEIIRLYPELEDQLSQRQSARTSVSVFEIERMFQNLWAKNQKPLPPDLELYRWWLRKEGGLRMLSALPDLEDLEALWNPFQLELFLTVLEKNRGPLNLETLEAENFLQRLTRLRKLVGLSKSQVLRGSGVTNYILWERTKVTPKLRNLKKLIVYYVNIHGFQAQSLRRYLGADPRLVFQKLQGLPTNQILAGIQKAFFSEKEMSRALGISPPAYQLRKKGKFPVKSHELRRFASFLAQKFEVPLAEVYGLFGLENLGQSIKKLETLPLRQRLQKLRDLVGMKQSKAAAIIGIKTNTYSLWELGKRNPDSRRLKKLADGYIGQFGFPLEESYHALGMQTPKEVLSALAGKSLREVIRGLREKIAYVSGREIVRDLKARNLKVGYSTYRFWEMGKQKPIRTTRRAIAEYYWKNYLQETGASFAELLSLFGLKSTEKALDELEGKSFSQVLRGLRKAAIKSRKDLGRILGMHPQVYGGIEAGKKHAPIPLSRLEALVDFYVVLGFDRSRLKKILNVYSTDEILDKIGPLTFRETVVEIPKLLGISQHQLAKLSRINNQTYINWVYGREVPREMLLDRFATALRDAFGFNLIRLRRILYAQREQAERVRRAKIRFPPRIEALLKNKHKNAEQWKKLIRYFVKRVPKGIARTKKNTAAYSQGVFSKKKIGNVMTYYSLSYDDLDLKRERMERKSKEYWVNLLLSTARSLKEQGIDPTLVNLSKALGRKPSAAQIRQAMRTHKISYTAVEMISGYKTISQRLEEHKEEIRGHYVSEVPEIIPEIKLGSLLSYFYRHSEDIQKYGLKKDERRTRPDYFDNAEFVKELLESDPEVTGLTKDEKVILKERTAPAGKFMTLPALARLLKKGRPETIRLAEGKALKKAGEHYRFRFGREPIDPKRLSLARVERLGYFDSRIRRVFKKFKIRTIRKLLNTPQEALLGQKNFKRASLKKIEKRLLANQLEWNPQTKGKPAGRAKAFDSAAPRSGQGASNEGRGHERSRRAEVRSGLSENEKKAAQAIRNHYSSTEHLEAALAETEDYFSLILSGLTKDILDPSIRVVGKREIPAPLAIQILDSFNIPTYHPSQHDRVREIFNFAKSLQVDETLGLEMRHKAEKAEQDKNWLLAWILYNTAFLLGNATSREGIETNRLKWKSALAQKGLKGELVYGVPLSQARKILGVQHFFTFLDLADAGIAHAAVFYQPDNRSGYFSNLLLTFNAEGKLIYPEPPLLFYDIDRFDFDPDEMKGNPSIAVTGYARGRLVSKTAFFLNARKDEIYKDHIIKDWWTRQTRLPLNEQEKKAFETGIQLVRDHQILSSTLDRLVLNLKANKKFKTEPQKRAFDILVRSIVEDHSIPFRVAPAYINPRLIKILREIRKAISRPEVREKVKSSGRASFKELVHSQYMVKGLPFIPTLELPFMLPETLVLAPRWLGVIGTLGVVGIHEPGFSRIDLENLIKQSVLAGQSEEEFFERVKALEDSGRDGTGIDASKKSGNEKTPVILQIDLKALAHSGNGLKDRLRNLSPGSVVVAYADTQAKGAMDVFSGLMREFPLLRYERKSYVGALDLREVKQTRDRWSREMEILPEHSGFLFADPKHLLYQEEMKNLGIVFQFDTNRLAGRYELLKKQLGEAIFGELAEYATLDEASRKQVLHENQTNGLFNFANGAYSFNLDMWIDLRTPELVSQSA